MILLFSPRNFASSLITASSDMEIHGTKFQVTLHIAYVHAFVNPVLFLSLHRGLRQGLSEFFCGCCESIAGWILGPSIPVESVQPPRYEEPIETVPSPPEPPMSQPNTCPDLTDVALLKPPLPPTGKHLLVLEIFLHNPSLILPLASRKEHRSRERSLFERLVCFTRNNRMLIGG